MKFTKNVRPEVIEQWHSFVDNFQFPVLDFYEMVKKELEVRKIPGLTVAIVKWKEGGILSDERQYLRLSRERWVFDICAAPFGTGYLFSYRFTEPPTRVSFLALAFVILLLVAIPIGSYSALRAYMNQSSALLIILVTIASAVAALGMNTKTGEFDIDSALLKIPGIGPFYDRYFREQTYYREDTRLMYLATVPAIMKALVSQVTASDGVKKPITQEAKPVLAELAGLT